MIVTHAGTEVKTAKRVGAGCRCEGRCLPNPNPNLHPRTLYNPACQLLRRSIRSCAACSASASASWASSSRDRPSSRTCGSSIASSSAAGCASSARSATSPTSGDAPTCSRSWASRSIWPIPTSAGSSAPSTISKTAARSCATCGTKRATCSTTRIVCTRADWRAIFGPFDRPYRDKYRPVPFSRNYVRHIEGWYAQKHPDEDFAETFAVWLTPGSAWRRRYKGWPAMRKLRYVDRMARTFADQEPIVRTGEVDITVDDMRLTVEEFYERAEKERDTRIDLAMDAHLSEIFLTRKPREGRPAAAIVTEIPARADRQDYLLDRRAPARRARPRRGDLQELRAPEAVGRSRAGAGLPGRADGVRHDARDEFPASGNVYGGQA